MNRVTKNKETSWVEWHTTVIPAFRRQRQEHLCKFKARLIYIVSLKTVWATVMLSQKKRKTSKQKTIQYKEKSY